MNEVWITGAAGRIGFAVARDLMARSIAVVLLERDQRRLDDVAGKLGSRVRTIVAGSFEEIMTKLKAGNPAVVVYTVGPFARTALPVIRASGKAHYLDLSNELNAAIDTLAQHDAAVTQKRTYVTGAGWACWRRRKRFQRSCRATASRRGLASVIVSLKDFRSGNNCLKLPPCNPPASVCAPVNVMVDSDNCRCNYRHDREPVVGRWCEKQYNVSYPFGSIFSHDIHEMTGDDMRGHGSRCRCCRGVNRGWPDASLELAVNCHLAVLGEQVAPFFMPTRVEKECGPSHQFLAGVLDFQPLGKGYGRAVSHDNSSFPSELGLQRRGQ